MQKAVFSTFVGFGQHVSFDVRASVIDCKTGEKRKFLAISQNVGIDRRDHGAFVLDNESISRVGSRLLEDLERMAAREGFPSIAYHLRDIYMELDRRFDNAESVEEEACLVLNAFAKLNGQIVLMSDSE